MNKERQHELIATSLYNLLTEGWKITVQDSTEEDDYPWKDSFKVTCEVDIFVNQGHLNTLNSDIELENLLFKKLQQTKIFKMWKEETDGTIEKLHEKLKQKENDSIKSFYSQGEKIYE